MPVGKLMMNRTSNIISFLAGSSAKPAETEVPATVDLGAGVMERPCQVVLHNDDVNTFEHVIRCLMRVFGHTAVLAGKIAMETHTRGRSIAEVESRDQAMLHRDQLVSYGLSATVEEV